MQYSKGHYQVTDFKVIGDGISDDTDSFQIFLDYVSSFQEGKAVRVSGGKNIFAQNFSRIDLCGKSILVNSPIDFKAIHGVILTNGSIIAGEKFKSDEFLLRITNINTIKLENLILECNKKCSGIFVHQFLRVRIEDCTIMHQTEYGIYSSEKGTNHELEVVKCNIVEYNWADGINENTKGKLPAFNISKNRTSTGIFLGQADNVIADSNINLCKVGIKVGMRANRIHGNHITSGGVKDNKVFDGIILNKHVKSSCLIVNNYIDNCRIKIYANSRPVNERNYITITDNLFYRGFNHPKNDEFNHIVLRPMSQSAILQNIIISDNQFYTQDEHLDDEKSRYIIPVKVDRSPLKNKSEHIIPYFDKEKIKGAIMTNNVFTNAAPYFEQPMGTNITGVIDYPENPTDIYSIDMEKYIPWGEIQTYQITMTLKFLESVAVNYCVNKINNSLTIKTSIPVIARFNITVDVNNGYNDDKIKVN